MILLIKKNKFENNALNKLDNEVIDALPRDIWL